MPAQRAVNPTRINVAINSQMLAAIDMVIDNEGVTLTEAVRRLLMYGEMTYRTIRVEQKQMFIEDETGRHFEVVLI
jgi:hypothetical protein